MIAIVGFNAKKLLSYSSASTTIKSPEPSFVFVSRLCTRPPTTKVGSFFEWDKIVPTIDDVVVLPCVPPTAILVSLTEINSNKCLGLGYEFQILNEFDIEPHDFKLGRLITPEGYFKNAL